MDEWTVVATKKKKKKWEACDRGTENQSTSTSTSNATRISNTLQISKSREGDTLAKGIKPRSATIPPTYKNSFARPARKIDADYIKKTLLATEPNNIKEEKKGILSPTNKNRENESCTNKETTEEKAYMTTLNPPTPAGGHMLYRNESLSDIFSTFPYEVVLHTLSFLDVISLLSFSLASTVHYGIALADAIWKPIFIRDWSLRRGQGKKSRRKKRTTPEQGKWRDRYISLVLDKQRSEENKKKREKSLLRNYSDLFVVRSRLYSVAQKTV